MSDYDPNEAVGGGWNYRLLRRQTEHGGQVAIHEVYYDENGDPRACTKEPVAIAAGEVDRLEEDMELMTEAFEKPVLNYENI